MLIFRLLSGLIALIVIADFTFVTARTDGFEALVPALIGAVVIASLCWRDTAAGKQRRLLAFCVWLLAACLAASLVLEAVLRGGASDVVIQMTLIGALAVVTSVTAHKAMIATRRRRERLGYHAYYDNEDVSTPMHITATTTGSNSAAVALNGEAESDQRAGPSA